jgi:hypothetical protein
MLIAPPQIYNLYAVGHEENGEPMYLVHTAPSNTCLAHATINGMEHCFNRLPPVAFYPPLQLAIDYLMTASCETTLYSLADPIIRWVNIYDYPMPLGLHAVVNYACNAYHELENAPLMPNFN